MVEVIQNSDRSLVEVFRQFDIDKDGTIDHSEFITAMESMKISMGKSEQEIFFLFMDMDGKGYIKYEEFMRILKRAGLKSISSDEKIVYSIYEALQRQNLTILDAFKAFDSNQDNQVTVNEVANTMLAMDPNIKRE